MAAGATMTWQLTDVEPVCRSVCRSGRELEGFSGPGLPYVSTKTAAPLGPAVFGDRCSTN